MIHVINTLRMDHENLHGGFKPLRTQRVKILF